MPDSITAPAEVKVAAAIAVLLPLFEKYVFSDWQFVAFLAVFVALDTATGLIAAWKNRRLNSRKMWPLVTKVLGYFALLIITHGLNHFTIKGEANTLFLWLDRATYSFIMGREALSIIENLSMIDKAIVPAWLRARLEQVTNYENVAEQTAAFLQTEKTTEAAPVVEPAKEAEPTT